jgi:hypothetical protein
MLPQRRFLSWVFPALQSLANRSAPTSIGLMSMPSCRWAVKHRSTRLQPRLQGTHTRSVSIFVDRNEQSSPKLRFPCRVLPTLVAFSLCPVRSTRQHLSKATFKGSLPFSVLPLVKPLARDIPMSAVRPPSGFYTLTTSSSSLSASSLFHLDSTLGLCPSGFSSSSVVVRPLERRNLRDVSPPQRKRCLRFRLQGLAHRLSHAPWLGY